MARRLAAGLQGLPGVRLLFPVEANGVFVELTPALVAGLGARGWQFYRFVGEHGYRLHGQLGPEQVDALLADARALAQG
jgi:threonine aldolase